jgi:ABC-2 type transport system permease protein
MKRNWLLLTIFFGVLTMYMGIMISMYNPDDMQSISSMLDLFPEDLMKAMGFSNMVSDLTEYLASWLYGLLMFGFPLVYCAILGNRLVAKLVDNSSFACLLSTPNSRSKIIFTQGLYALLSITALFAALFGIGVFFSSVMHPGLLDISAFLSLNLTTLLVNMTVIMISFFFSCLFNESRLSLSFGAGLPIAFLLFNMLGGASDKAEVLKKLSIYGWYDPVDLVHGAVNILQLNLIYATAVIGLFAAGLLIFKRKQLPV